MKEKIKNGYFFTDKYATYMRVGSRAFCLPIYDYDHYYYVMFKNIKEEDIKAVFKANGERVA